IRSRRYASSSAKRIRRPPECALSMVLVSSVRSGSYPARSSRVEVVEGRAAWAPPIVARPEACMPSFRLDALQEEEELSRPPGGLEARRQLAARDRVGEPDSLPPAFDQPLGIGPLRFPGAAGLGH